MSLLTLFLLLLGRVAQVEAPVEARVGPPGIKPENLKLTPYSRPPRTRAQETPPPSKVAGAGGKENNAPDVRTYDEMMRTIPPSVPTGKRYSTTKSTRAVRAQNASKSEISTADAAADESGEVLVA